MILTLCQQIVLVTTKRHAANVSYMIDLDCRFGGPENNRSKRRIFWVWTIDAVAVEKGQNLDVFT